jgi:ATP-binding cassette subfamily B protein
VKYFPRAWKYLWPFRKLAGASVVLLVLSALSGLLIPWPLKYIIDNVLQNRPLPDFLAIPLAPFVGSPLALLICLALASFLLVLLQDVLNVLSSYVNTKIDQGMTLDFRSDLFRHVQALSLATHDQRRSGMLIYAINSMAGCVAQLIMALPPLAQSLLSLVGMVCISYFIDPVMALVSLAVVPFLYYWVCHYVKRIQPELMRVKGLEGESLSIIHEAISMLRVIIAFGRENHEYQRFRRQGEEAIIARVKLTVRQTLFSLAVNATTALGTALVLGYGAYRVLQGELTAGELLVVLAYIAAVYKPLEAISTTIGSLQDVFVSLQLAFGVLEVAPEVRDAPDAVAIHRARGHIAYEGVEFSYTGRVDTLKSISFEVQPGQVIGIVGPTGAGKTTLVSLLPRFYDSKKGKILLDGTDIRKLTVQSLRAQISVVLQEPLLFSGTIAENIRYGRLDATLEEVMEAARAANAHDFIMRLPNQYDTELGERGAKLSGGERQRIAVARAFIKDAPVLILDEPTSSVDSKTEAVILEALERLMEGRTTFMIAHRLSTLRRADMILVLDHGRLVEQGSHEELLHRNGLYKQLHDMQSRHAHRSRQRV